MNKIEINALMKFDNIKIIATMKSKNGIIYVHDEKINLSTNKKRGDIKKDIKNALLSIESKTSKKIKEINIIFDDFMKNSELLKVKTKIIKESTKYEVEKKLNYDDYQTIVQRTINNQNANNEILISAVPFKFIFVESGSANECESYSFPFDKKVSKLAIIFSLRFMDKNSFLKTVDYFDSLDIKVNNVALESQLVIYNGIDNEKLNKVNFALAIKNDKTILISSDNNVVIRTDILEYSFENLVKKIEDKFGISNQEAKNLIQCYGKINVGTNEDKEIIYSSYSLKEQHSNPINRSDVANVIKSFLKSICSQANNIIKKITKNNGNNFELKIIGKLSRINDLSNYCSKYFEKVNVLLSERNESIYSWNKSFESVKNYWMYLKMLDNKMNTETFYYNNNKDSFNRDSTYQNKQAIKSTNKRSVEVLLA